MSAPSQRVLKGLSVQVYKKMKKDITWNIRRLVDESFVLTPQRTSTLYCRLTDSWRVHLKISENFFFREANKAMISKLKYCKQIDWGCMKLKIKVKDIFFTHSISYRVYENEVE